MGCLQPGTCTWNFVHTPVSLSHTTSLSSVSIQFHMGVCGEDTAEKYSITRKEQDEYARRSEIKDSFADQIPLPLKL